MIDPIQQGFLYNTVIQTTIPSISQKYGFIDKKLFSFLFSKCMYEYLYSICCLILFSICPFGNAPTITSIICPSLMIIRVGIL